MGYNPECWGPTWWYFLYKYAAFLPDNLTKEQSEEIKQMLYYLFKTLPCQGCSMHAVEYHKDNIKNFTTGKEVFTWINNMHNEVTKRTSSKGVGNLTDDQLYAIYRSCNVFNDKKGILVGTEDEPVKEKIVVKKVYKKKKSGGKSKTLRLMDYGALLLLGGFLVYCD